MDIQDVELERSDSGWRVGHGGRSLDLTERELVKLVFGPERYPDFAPDLFPIHFYQMARRSRVAARWRTLSSDRRVIMKIKKTVFMLVAPDTERAIAFYEEVIGLEAKYRWPSWTELGHGDAVVALHGGGNGEFKIRTSWGF